jgi:hypothetical protein
MISATGGSLEVDADLSPGGINGDVVSQCSTADCVDSSVSNVAKKPNQKQVRQAQPRRSNSGGILRQHRLRS